jgi:hypothetical protein
MGVGVEGRIGAGRGSGRRGFNMHLSDYAREKQYFIAIPPRINVLSLHCSSVERNTYMVPLTHGPPLARTPTVTPIRIPRWRCKRSTLRVHGHMMCRVLLHNLLHVWQQQLLVQVCGLYLLSVHSIVVATCSTKYDEKLIGIYSRVVVSAAEVVRMTGR